MWLLLYSVFLTTILVSLMACKLLKPVAVEKRDDSILNQQGKKCINIYALMALLQGRLQESPRPTLHADTAIDPVGQHAHPRWLSILSEML